MLDLGHDAGVSGFNWESIPLRAALPLTEDDFWKSRGPVPVRAGCRRSFARLHLRRQAILRLADGTMLAGYTTDISRKGLGLLSPVQLFPKDGVVVRVAGSRDIRVDIVRCRRLAPGSYACGAVFGRQRRQY